MLLFYHFIGNLIPNKRFHDGDQKFNKEKVYKSINLFEEFTELNIGKSLAILEIGSSVFQNHIKFVSETYFEDNDSSNCLIRLNKRKECSSLIDLKRTLLLSNSQYENIIENEDLDVDELFDSFESI